MKLQLYNTYSKRLENFTPLDPSNIRIYACGPTVYDLIHIGNARPIVVFDLLVRLMRYLYPRVTYVRNITDVDDKINLKARENNEKIDKLTSRTIKLFHEDALALCSLKPDIEPRATKHIHEMIEMIRTLLDNGHAYLSEGHVIFSVPSMPEYGKLSGRKLEEMIDGARVEVASYKKNPADFILWKPSKSDDIGWDSEFGRGRPGWHIECSAMSAKYLGERFDIHGGGLDLIFPHHENEIAQSCCAFKSKMMAQIWMHNGYVTVDGDKMSKSLGNFVTVRDALEKFPGEVVRYSLLSGHYRSPIDFSFKGLKEAKLSLDRLYRAISTYDKSNDFDDEFIKALTKDLNTPEAFARLHELAKEANKGSELSAQKLFTCGKLIGLFNNNPLNWFKEKVNDDGKKIIEELILKRKEARSKKDFSSADKIRNQLRNMGVIIEDGSDGTSWRREK